MSDFRWPLDPALAEGRDETTLASALYATPLRIDSTTGSVRPGLCSGWSASPDFRRWVFVCRSAPSIAAALRRVARLREARLHWIFEGAEIRADAARVTIRLQFPWRRFPYVLTAVGTAPRFVPGSFRVVRGSPTRVIVRQPGLTVDFRRLAAPAAARAFRRGELDEAPVPLGEIVATRSELGDAVRARTLLALDVVVWRRLRSDLRRVYWETTNRGDYEELVPEQEGAAAFGVAGGDDRFQPKLFRGALNAIPSLPRVRVRIGVPADPVLRDGARLLAAQWRDFGLGPQLLPEGAPGLDGSLRRVLAAYPQEEAIPAELALRDHGVPVDPIRRVLAAIRQHDRLEQLDDELRTAASVMPVAWVVDARLVSPRLVGWHEDALGNVDYAVVRSRGSSPRP